MGTFVKEYGLIAVLIVVALSGYFLIGDRRGDIMDYTLDMVGTRLIELAQGEDEKEEIARQFAAFSERVERDEVSPEMIETVAANVLNLRARGAVITPKEAELMLYQEPGGVLPTPSDSGLYGRPAVAYSIPKPPKTTVKVDKDELGDRITYMFELADAVGESQLSGESRLQFARDEHGVHVIIDPSMESFFESASVSHLKFDFDEADWVRWEEDLAEQQERHARRLERQAKRMEALEMSQTTRVEEAEAIRFDALKRLQKLAMMGATTDLDTLILYQEVDNLLEGLNFEIQTSLETESTGSVGSGSSVRVFVQTDSTDSQQ